MEEPARPLRVLDTGEGPAVLLLHGFTGSVEAWGERLLDGLGARARVLAVDLPGHGWSPSPPTPEGYRMRRTVDRLCRELDRRDIDRAVWVGYSMGGRLALGAAVLCPERVRALVLEGASPGLATDRERGERRRADERLARRIEAEGMEAFVDRWMELPLFESQRRLPAEVRERERRRRLGNRPSSLAACLRGMGTGTQPGFWDDLGGVDVPTLLLTGALDGKFTRLAGEMADALPKARSVTVPGAGHTVHLERPERWLREVASFLEGLPLSGR